jgi:hypothetical protein
MGWAGIYLAWPLTRLAVGRPGLGLCMGWDGHGLALSWAGHGLASPCAWLEMGIAAHGLA